MQPSRQEDFGCLDIQIEIPRQTQLDQITRDIRFHAHQVETLRRSFKVGQLCLNDIHTEQVLEGVARTLKSFD